MITKSTTPDLLMQNKCYCLKREKIIFLDKCNVVDCRRFKACMKKSRRDYDKHAN